MNRYKIISICSLTIVIMLVISLLFPNRTVANEKESMELALYYEKSVVTVNIAVNSDKYTGVVCKYLMVDDVLLYDDLENQVKGKGKTINLEKAESDKYETRIQNVDKRYVVVYATIGNCGICEYIDCKSDGAKTIAGRLPENNGDENKENNVNNIESTENNANKSEENANTKQEEPQQQENNSKQEENNKQEEQGAKNQEVAAEPEKVENIKEENKEEAKTQEQEKVKATSTSNKDDELVVSNNQAQQGEIEEIEVEENKEEPKKEEDKKTDDNKESNQQSNKVEKSQENNTGKNNSKKESTKTTTDKYNIKKTNSKSATTTSVAEGSMPKTGENDGIKFVAIAIFSIIAGFSFYKYKITKE